MTQHQLADQAQLRTSRRTTPIVLLSDASQSAACVLKFIQTGETAFDRKEAIEAMAGRVELLREATGEQVERELLGHAAILDSLFQRYTLLSLTATIPQHQLVFGSLALKTQAAYTRTVTAVEALRQARPRQVALDS